MAFNAKKLEISSEWESIINDSNPSYGNWSQIRYWANICSVYPKVSQCLKTYADLVTSAETSCEIDEEDLKQVKAKELLDKTLFNNSNFNFKELQSEILSCLTYGNSLFECNFNPSSKYLEAVNFIHPQKINSYTVVNNQLINAKINGANKEIELVNKDSAMLLITRSKKGNNVYGESMLRPLFAPINHIGMPMLSLLSKLTSRASGQLTVEITNFKDFMESIKSLDLDQKEIETQLASVLSGNTNAVALSAGTKITSIPNAHTFNEVLQVSKDIDNKITDAFNLTWLNGMGEITGSYALANSMAGIFYNSLSGLCKSINQQVQQFLNRYVNYHCGIDCPAIITTGIEDSNASENVNKIKLLAEHNLLDIQSDQGREMLAKELNLPLSLISQLQTPTVKKTSNQEPENAELSQAVKFAQKHPVSKLMDNAQQQIISIVQDYFNDNQDTFIKKVHKQWDSGKALDATIGNKPKLYKAIKQYISDVVTQTTDITLDGSGLTAGDLKKSVKFAAEKVEFAQADLTKVISSMTQRELNKLINIYHDAIFNGLEDINIDSPTAAKAKIMKVSDEFINGKLSGQEQDGSASIKLAAAMVAAKVVNQTRAAIVKDPAVDARIESYEYMNGDPKSQICQELQGRVFTKQEYAASSNKPPLHHNCKSFIRIQYVGNKNKPLSRASNGQPLGLGNVTPEALKSISL